MSDSTKFEFIQMLDEYEALTREFDLLQAETQRLKEAYSQDPSNPEILASIKVQEEKYRITHEKFADLNRRSAILREKSDAEHNTGNK